ncbi:MAG: large subunit ribosomal protein L9 [Candidatus Omnitrophota bacterium]|jgi:large subunit ribosomal protein L9
MEVILIKSIENLGKIGDVVKVKDGYARNMLLPQKLAFLATPSNLKRIAKLEAARKAEHDVEKKVAEDLVEKLGKASPTVNVEVNDQEKLYGSITETDIVKALEVEGFSIEKKQISLEKPIEELGIFDVDIKLHSEVTAKIRLWVTKK